MEAGHLRENPQTPQQQETSEAITYFFLTGALCLSAGRGVLRLTRLPRHDRGPLPGGNRSAASCLCTVLRRALYHYSTRSPHLKQSPNAETCQESKGRGLLQLVKRKNFCPGVVCCLGRAASQSPHWSQ